MVIKDEATKEQIGEWYLDSWTTSYGPMREAAMAVPAMSKTFASADYPANHLAGGAGVDHRNGEQCRRRAGVAPRASVYPAVQNLMLAARALGLGTTLTTLHRAHEEKVTALLGIPEGTETMALIPLGWPNGKFGPDADARRCSDVLGEVGRRRNVLSPRAWAFASDLPFRTISPPWRRSI